MTTVYMQTARRLSDIYHPNFFEKFHSFGLQTPITAVSSMRSCYATAVTMATGSQRVRGRCKVATVIMSW